HLFAELLAHGVAGRLRVTGQRPHAELGAHLGARALERALELCARARELGGRLQKGAELPGRRRDAVVRVRALAAHLSAAARRTVGRARATHGSHGRAAGYGDEREESDERLPHGFSCRAAVLFHRTWRN